MNNILLVDDEFEITDIMTAFLQRHKYNVFKAYNGEEALKIFHENQIDLLITDIMMPTLNGIELIKKVKQEINKNLPIVVITGQIKEANFKEAIALGINTLIEKPFNRKALLQALERIKEFPNEKLADSFLYKKVDEFLPLPIEGFKAFPCARHDTYMKISDSKFLLILRKGDELTPDRIDKYMEKNVKELYVKKIDHQEILDSEISKFKSLPKDMSRTEKINGLNRINEIIMTEIYSENIDKAVFISSMEVVKMNVEMIMTNNELYDLLKSLENFSNDIFRHSAGVSIMSSMISKKFGWNSNGILFKLNLASFYHDVGKKLLNKKNLEKSFALFTDEDWFEYKKHPALAGELLGGISDVPEDVIKIVLEHHENYFGGGYPNNLNYSALNPLTKIFSIANDYCALTLKQSINRIYTHEEAIKTMCDMKDRYDGEIFTEFLKLFKNS